MKKLLLFSISFLVITIAYSQPGQKTYPVLSTQLNVEGAHMSAERLSRIDKTVQEYVDQKWLAGAVAIVYRNGNLAYYKAFGADDIDKKTMMQKDGIFRLASQTKAI